MAKAESPAKAESNVFRAVFGRRSLEGVPELPLEDIANDTGHVRYVEPLKPPADLTGRPIVMLLLGDGHSGKTLYARWLISRMQEAGREAALAALDPGTRALASWYEGVDQPPGRDTAVVRDWLSSAFDGLRESPSPAILDFGGGGLVPLEQILSTAPDLVDALQNAGVGLVCCYLLTPRVDDINLVDRLRKLGLRPAAQMLVLNEGTIKGAGTGPREAFDLITRHSAFRRALDDGAFPVQVPALPMVAEEIEAKRLRFSYARDGKVPPGAKFAPIGGLKRSAVGRWLQQMEEAHQQIASWLP